MKLLFISLFVVIGTVAKSQSEVLWSENYEVDRPNHFSDTPILSTTPESVKVTGRKSIGTVEVLTTVEYDLLGSIIATSEIGSDVVENNNLIDYQVDVDENIYVLHEEKLGFYKKKIIIQKYDLTGDLIWVQEINNLLDTSYTAKSITMVNDTAFFVAYYKEYDYPEEGEDFIETEGIAYVNSYNSSGDLIWEKALDSNTELYWFDHRFFWHVDNILVNDNIVYYFGNNVESDNALLKLDLSGTATVINDLPTINGIGNAQITPDGNLLIASLGKYRLTKLDLEGNLIWATYYETFLPDHVSGDQIHELKQDNLGNIYITGRHYGDDYGTETYSNADILTLKYDLSGELVWENRYEFGINNADIGNCLELKNGSVFVGGASQREGAGTDYDYVMLRLDSASGDYTGEYRYQDAFGGEDEIYGISVFDDGKIALTGYTESGSNFDWTTQLLVGKDLSVSEFNIGEKQQIEIYPNPIRENEVLKFTNNGYNEYAIMSTDGRTIVEGLLESNDQNEIMLNNISSGIYILLLRNEREFATINFVIH